MSYQPQPTPKRVRYEQDLVQKQRHPQKVIVRSLNELKKLYPHVNLNQPPHLLPPPFRSHWPQKSTHNTIHHPKIESLKFITTDSLSEKSPQLLPSAESSDSWHVEYVPRRVPKRFNFRWFNGLKKMLTRHIHGGV